MADTVKSFRFDSDSIKEAIESWPAFLFALAVSASLVYLGWLNVAWRGTLIVFGAIYFGYTMRGTITQGLRSKYPNAACICLVSIGLTSTALGVIARMLLPSLQGGLTDYIWIAISFSTILTFVVINRRDPDVLK